MRLGGSVKRNTLLTVDGFLEEHTSEVKDIREEDRSAMSSSQEDRQKHPETIAKNRNHEKASVLESDVKWTEQPVNINM